MPKINVTLKLSNENAALVAANQATLMGLLKNSTDGRIIKHVPLAIQTEHRLAGQVIGTLIGAGVSILVPVVTTFLTEVIKKKFKEKRNSEKQASKTEHDIKKEQYAIA